MPILHRRYALVPIVIGLAISFGRAQFGPTLQELAVTVRGASREFAYTNKRDAFLSGETCGAPRSSWQGFVVRGRKMLDSYSLLINGSPLPPDSAEHVVVYPDRLERHYRSGIVEEVRPVDSLDLFAVIVIAPHPVEISFIPWFTDLRTRDRAVVELRQELTLIARKAHLGDPDSLQTPSWLAVGGTGTLPALHDANGQGRYSPIVLTSHSSRRRMFVIAAAKTAGEAARLVQTFPNRADRAFKDRQRRIARVLADSPVRTGNRSFDKALAWARVSLDALMMESGNPGIYAGLPWFANYWGRDTFVSLPGALLVTGRFREARAILLSFANAQERDTASTNFGRIPNFITGTERAYNTADGTPRFIAVAREYIERSGDTTLVPPLWPVVVRSIEGTRRFHSDSLGFLTHANAETWMDAAGPEGPWSPRGNRANDIQALWATQLETGVWFATLVGDVDAARGWTELLQKVKRNFAPTFVRGGKLADRIASDGTPDMSVRPNQIFTAPLLNEQTRSSVLRAVVNTLTYPYGVASLSQNDNKFHPYHQYPPLYPKDAAYHNGTVWTWLQGPVISELCRIGEQNLAWRITGYSTRQILDRGAVGTLSELLDALPRPGKTEPELSGTFSQAWSLAEFIRNFYDDYLGLEVHRVDRTIRLRPGIPDSLGNVDAALTLDGRRLTVRKSTRAGQTTFSIQTDFDGKPWKGNILVRTSGDRQLEITYVQPARGIVKCTVRGDSLLAWKGTSDKPTTTLRSAPALPPETGQLKLAEPELRPDLPCLRGPAYPLLPNSTIKHFPAGAPLRARATDAEGDDTGVVAGTTLSYPRNSAFIPGSFDIRSFEVRSDSDNVYFHLQFRALSDPGWHPEYGFQLTFAAIAVDTDGIPGSGALRVPWNASFTLPPKHAFDRLILVGGGVRVEDARGNVLGAYLPAPEDVRNTLGDASRGTIDFSLPQSILGKPASGWHFTVLVGGQDDHGGSGLGEFRTVDATGGEWNGGGKLRQEDPNIYDLLEASVK